MGFHRPPALFCVVADLCARGAGRLVSSAMTTFAGLCPTLATVVTVVQPWLERYGLWVLALGLFGETFLFTGAVVPGFALLVAAGYLVADGTFSPLPTVLVAWVSAICGDQGGYWLGYFWGSRLLGKRLHLVEPLRAILELEGVWLLLLYHYVPWFRTIFPVVVGSSGYRYPQWLALDTGGVLVWIVAALTLGYTAHGAVTHGSTLGRVLDIATVLVILVISWRIYHGVSQRIPTDTGTDKETHGRPPS